ncbi:glycosyltransferase [Sulfurospirillum arcachonense]|uniref:glycosyltransferase n=1 Tax=Sulfurospirillum arcachonense TaxID=57666 RepID=UPI000468EA54|nr:glycosyltransferase [Sulfurospirillum arcachonense]
MIKYISRHDKDYSRYNIIKQLLKDTTCKNNIYVLLPFSKNQFIKHFFKRNKIINDFFISNYDTYVFDRKKISKINPRAWWKYFQDWINFRFSKYLLSDTQKHFEYWEKLFGKFSGKHFVLPVLADKNIYYPNTKEKKHDIIEILFYGSFIPLHGIDIILNAFKILENNNISFNANIIGNGQTFKEMKKLFVNLKLTNVKMDGNFITEKNLANKIRDTDIVLGVFGNSTKATSVVPNKVYQALACKKTIITMKSSALDEFFTSNDLIQCENKAEILAEKLIIIIENGSLRKQISTNGHNSFLDLYSKTQNNFINFIEQLDTK